jgi:hypothetical protein
MRRLVPVKNTMTNPTQITRVRFAFSPAADRSLNVGVRGGFYAPMHKAPAAKDVAHLRSGRLPV